MSDFDPVDDELGAALRRRAGSGDATMSTDAAHHAVLRRAGAIRRRRAAIGGGGAMAVLLIGGIALVPRGGDEIGPLDTGDVLPTFDDTTTTTPEPDGTESGAAPITVDLTIPDTSTASVDISIPSTDATSSTTAVVSADAASSPDVTPSTGATVSTDTTPSTSSVVSTDAAPSTSSVVSMDTVPGTSEPATTAPETTDAEPTLEPFTDTYRSAGGSITVSWNGSALNLQSISPTAGYVAEVEQSSTTRVRVRFEGADDDSRIEVRVDGGQLSVDID